VTGSSPARPLPALSLLLVGGAVAVLAALQASVARPWLTAGGLCAALFVLATVARPTVPVYFVLLAAPLAGLLRNLETFEVEGATVSLSGLRWLMVVVVLLLVLVFRRCRIIIPRAILALLPFALWVILMTASPGTRAQGLSDALFYLLPLLLAVYTATFFQYAPQRHLARAEKLILAGIPIPLILYSILIPAGLVTWTADGPQGLLGPRPVATYLVIALCVSLSRWRYAATRRQRRRAAALSMLAVALILFTMSRMASVTAMLLLGVFWMNPRRWWRLVPQAAVGLAVALAILMLIPQLRERIFHNPPANLEEAVEQLSLSGRDTMWRVTLEHALQSPAFGWGLGSSRPIVAKALPWEGRDQPPREFPPHNEYLQVFHDTGLPGVVLLLAGWVAMLVHFARGWARFAASGEARPASWFLASVLGIVVVLINAFMDNTLHYASVTGPLFVILACATLVARAPSPAEPAA
jgi:O-antigen ligase